MELQFFFILKKLTSFVYQYQEETVFLKLFDKFNIKILSIKKKFILAKNKERVSTGIIFLKNCYIGKTIFFFQYPLSHSLQKILLSEKKILLLFLNQNQVFFVNIINFINFFASFVNQESVFLAIFLKKSKNFRIFPKSVCNFRIEFFKSFLFYRSNSFVLHIHDVSSRRKLQTLVYKNLKFKCLKRFIFNKNDNLLFFKNFLPKQNREGYSDFSKEVFETIDIDRFPKNKKELKKYFFRSYSYTALLKRTECNGFDKWKKENQESWSSFEPRFHEIDKL